MGGRPQRGLKGRSPAQRRTGAARGGGHPHDRAVEMHPAVTERSWPPRGEHPAVGRAEAAAGVGHGCHRYHLLRGRRLPTERRSRRHRKLNTSCEYDGLV